MTTTWPPVVYVGPSLHADDARRWLPTCQTMPPIKRGDLYRDRLLGFQVFVVLDGVFAQQLALSPREIIDVVRDGATVVGACSMGAMRAAECWPAGVQGVGAIYRLFRRGRLTSDAEVAVACSPQFPFAPSSVPLINVRYALSRGVRDGVLSRPDARSLLQSAADLFFGDRTWELVFRMAGIADRGERIAALRRYDLKRMDAILALSRVRRWLEDGRPSLAAEHAPRIRRVLAPPPREAPQRPGAEVGALHDQEPFWQWLVATGRYRRYAPRAVAGALSGARTARSGAGSEDPESAHDRTSRRLARRLLRSDARLARAVRAEIRLSPDRDAVRFVFTAVTRAARWARHRDLTGGDEHRRLAMAEIARAHGFATWAGMRTALDDTPIWAWIERAVEDAALAKRLRQHLFSPTGDPGNRWSLRAEQEGCVT